MHCGYGVESKSSGCLIFLLVLLAAHGAMLGACGLIYAYSSFFGRPYGNEQTLTWLGMAGLGVLLLGASVLIIFRLAKR